MTRDQVIAAVNERADATTVTLTVEGKTTDGLAQRSRYHGRGR